MVMYGKGNFFVSGGTGTSKSHGYRLQSMGLCLQSLMQKKALARYTIESEGKPQQKPQSQPRIQRKYNVKSRFKY